MDNKEQKITFVMLHVERGEEETITVSSGESLLFVSCLLKAFTDHGHVLSTVIIKEGEN